jgi:hypothetical protein
LLLLSLLLLLLLLLWLVVGCCCDCLFAYLVVWLFGCLVVVVDVVCLLVAPGAVPHPEPLAELHLMPELETWLSHPGLAAASQLPPGFQLLPPQPLCDDMLLMRQGWVTATICDGRLRMPGAVAKEQRQERSQDVGQN